MPATVQISARRCEQIFPPFRAPWAFRIRAHSRHGTCDGVRVRGSGRMDDKAMEEREIVHMAAFKLEETARRLINLAGECNSRITREHLRALANVLLEQEHELRALRSAGESVVRRSRVPTAAPSTRIKRHAVG